MNRFIQLCAFVLGITFLVPVAGAQAMRFTATLSGGDQVPAIDTTAAGTATFRLNAAGDTLNYTINVTGIQDPAAAHIHMGAAGKNGPPVVVLYPNDASPAQTGAYTGALAKGSITAASLVGPLAGKNRGGPRGTIQSRKHVRERPHEGACRRRNSRPAWIAEITAALYPS